MKQFIETQRRKLSEVEVALGVALSTIVDVDFVDEDKLSDYSYVELYAPQVTVTHPSSGVFTTRYHVMLFMKMVMNVQ